MIEHETNNDLVRKTSRKLAKIESFLRRQIMIKVKTGENPETEALEIVN